MAARTPPRVPLWPLLIALDIIVLDRVSKYLVVRHLGPDGATHSIPLIGDWLRLVYLENTGISFGRLQDFSPYITILTAAIVIGLLVAYRRLIVPARWANAALGLILGGAVGNLIDRISTALRLGLDKAYVVDFIDLRYWAVFNVADSAITIGGILYGAYLLLFQREGALGEPEAKPCPRPGDPPLGE